VPTLSSTATTTRSCRSTPAGMPLRSW
jgi:hypothetical protein